MWDIFLVVEGDLFVCSFLRIRIKLAGFVILESKAPCSSRDSDNCATWCSDTSM